MKNIKEIIVQLLCAFVPCYSDSLVPGQTEAGHSYTKALLSRWVKKSNLQLKSTALKSCFIWSAVQPKVRRALFREIMVTFYMWFTFSLSCSVYSQSVMIL